MNAPVVLDSELEKAILARLQDVLGQIGWLSRWLVESAPVPGAL